MSDKSFNELLSDFKGALDRLNALLPSSQKENKENMEKLIDIQPSAEHPGLWFVRVRWPSIYAQVYTHRKTEAEAREWAEQQKPDPMQDPGLTWERITDNGRCSCD
jgi:hypothetical protein